MRTKFWFRIHTTGPRDRWVHDFIIFVHVILGDDVILISYSCTRHIRWWRHTNFALANINNYLASIFLFLQNRNSRWVSEYSTMLNICLFPPKWNFTAFTGLIALSTIVYFPQWNFTILLGFTVFPRWSVSRIGISTNFWVLLRFHNNLFSTLELHHTFEFYCVSTIVCFPHWYFITISGLFVIPQKSVSTFGISLHFGFICVSTIVCLHLWNFIAFWVANVLQHSASFKFHIREIYPLPEVSQNPTPWCLQ